MTGRANGATYSVGYKRPPEHSRFQPGRSGNPSGRPKDSRNFKTLLRQILNEQISLQDGVNSRKVSKREAITRRLIIGAMKGDSRDLHALFKLAEHTGEFEDANDNKTEVTIRWLSEGPAPDQPGGRQIPGISQVSRE